VPEIGCPVERDTTTIELSQLLGMNTKPESRCLADALAALATVNRKTPEQIDAAIRQLVSKAITTDGQVIDVFTAAGLPKPDISILSDQFLAEVRGLKRKHVAAELLEKLLKNELKVRSKRNLVQGKLFSEKLKQALNAYPQPDSRGSSPPPSETNCASDSKHESGNPFCRKPPPAL